MMTNIEKLNDQILHYLFVGVWLMFLLLTLPVLLPVATIGYLFDKLSTKLGVNIFD